MFPEGDWAEVLNNQVEAFLRRYLPAGGRLVLGYSGGLDSSVLLHLLAGSRSSLGFSLDALHVHHGLSPGADAWAAHCERVCRGLDVPLVVERVEVIREGEGPEAAARAARYRAFSRLDADALALAHHRDDQAETVLAQLLRGGGARGLAAMPPSRMLDGGRIRLLRPLLNVPRAWLLDWALDRGLEWVEDDSNRQLHLTRNALRHEVLPLLESRFPGAGATLARAAGRFAETAALLDDLADLDGGPALSAEGLALDRLAALPEARARNLLRRHLEQAGASIHAELLREGLRQLLHARGDACLSVTFGGVSLRRYRGRALLVPSDREGGPDGDAATPEPTGLWRGEAKLSLGDGGTLGFEPMIGGGVRLEPGPVTVRCRRGGERLRMAPNRPRRLLKDLLREAGIPPWQRDRMPLVYVGDQLAWVAELGPDAAFRAGEGERGWLISWDKPW
jgi:tRNA(Ile)-lysidine synthase